MKQIFKYLNNISLGYYKNIKKIYVIGDIHGDLDKFLSFLKSIKIIKSSSFPSYYDVYRHCEDVKNLNSDIIKYIEFDDEYLKSLTDICIVQLGDITDGHLNCDMLNNSYVKYDKIKYINNDIAIYAVINAIMEKFKKLKTQNCHFVLITGNHDIENIFNIIGHENKINYVDCKYTHGYENDIKHNSAWGNYILNNDELPIKDEHLKKFITEFKLKKRYLYLTNYFDIVHKMYLIVQINNDKVFSHTVIYKPIIEDIREKIYKIKLSNPNNLIGYINALLKYCMLKISKHESITSSDINEIIHKIKDDKEVENFVIDKLYYATKVESRKALNERAAITHKDIKHYFMGHEIYAFIERTRHNMFDLYCLDIGLSSSVYNVDTENKPYYVEIDEEKNTVNKCSNKNCTKLFYEGYNFDSDSDE